MHSPAIMVNTVSFCPLLFHKLHLVFYCNIDFRAPLTNLQEIGMLTNTTSFLKKSKQVRFCAQTYPPKKVWDCISG